MANRELACVRRVRTANGRRGPTWSFQRQRVAQHLSILLREMDALCRLRARILSSRSSRNYYKDDGAPVPLAAQGAPFFFLRAITRALQMQYFCMTSIPSCSAHP